MRKPSLSELLQEPMQGVYIRRAFRGTARNGRNVQQAPAGSLGPAASALTASLRAGIKVATPMVVPMTSLRPQLDTAILLASFGGIIRATGCVCRIPARSWTPQESSPLTGSPAPKRLFARIGLIQCIAAHAIGIAFDGQLEVRVSQDDSGYLASFSRAMGRSGTCRCQTIRPTGSRSDHGGSRVAKSN